MKRELIKCHENDLLVYFPYPHLPSVLFYYCSAGEHDNDTSMPAESNSLCNDVSVVDDQMYYCMLCLSKVQKDKSSNISEIKSYSLTSSTDPLRNHLITIHKIPLGVSV